MSHPSEHPDHRIQELLADQALEGLSDSDRQELRGLIEDSPELSTEDYEATAAALDLALIGSELPPLPDSLRARIEADAGLDSPQGLVFRNSASMKLLAAAGWLAAAASWLVSSTTFWPSIMDDPSRQMQRLRADARAVDLRPTEHPLARGSSGELVWSQPRQEGYLKLVGLAGVDPSQGSYQLWIFDTGRDPRFPIDGGRFTIPDEARPTVVPIRPPLPVGQPSVFAVTLEPPGGVVVSDRRRIMLQGALPERPADR